MKRMIVLVVMLVSVVIGEEYNPQKAVDYAHRYVINEKAGQECDYWTPAHACTQYWNPYYTKDLDGEKISSSATDCIHFVSQAIHAGGVPWDFEKENGIYSIWFDKGGKRFSRSRISSTDTYTYHFKTRIERDLFPDHYFKRIDPFEAKPGDVALRHFGGCNSTLHAMLVTKKPKNYHNRIGIMYYTAHTSDRYDAQWGFSVNDNECRKFYVYRIISKIPKAKLGTTYGELNSNDKNSKYGHRSTAKADLYKFELKNDGLITFHQHSPNHDLDSWLTLLDSNKRVITHDDDNDRNVDVGGNIYGRDSVIKAQLSAGTYYLEVSSYGSRDYGKYELKILGQSTAYLYSGGVVDDRLTSSSPTSQYRSRRYAKRYLLKIEYGGYYTVKLDMSDSMDAYLYITKQGKNYYFARSDDTGRYHGMGKRDSYIRKYFSPGIYVIEATTYGRGRTGNFTLTIED